MSEISIDVNEITGPMLLKRDELLAQAAEFDTSADKARAEAKDAAERALNRGEAAAEGFEQEAATRRAYAARWDVIIAREQTEAGVIPAEQPMADDALVASQQSAVKTAVDGLPGTGEVAGNA